MKFLLLLRVRPLVLEQIRAAPKVVTTPDRGGASQGCGSAGAAPGWS